MPFPKGHSNSNPFSILLQVNVTGTFNVVRLAAAVIAQNDQNSAGQRGVIINTSGIEAFEGRTWHSAVVAANAAINAMTAPLAKDLGNVGIRVNTIVPGFFETPIWKNTTREVLENAANSKILSDPADFAQLVQAIIENPTLNAAIIRLDNGIRLLP